MRKLQYLFMTLAALCFAMPAFAQTGSGSSIDLVPIGAGIGMALAAGLCGLGQGAPNPVFSTLRYFRDEYMAHIDDRVCPAGVCPIAVPAVAGPSKAGGDK